tara:strand:- start:1403 stop:1993 length:591 start_codon:yes stop_codon:yes gene_type:complete
LTEFLLIASIHLVAVISPGPDFAVVLRQSLSSTRKSSIYTALGIATSEFIHCLYSIFGMELIMKYQENVFLVLKPIAILYLFYLGISSFFTNRPSEKLTQSSSKNFSLGFMTNLLNFQASTFTVTLFFAIVNINTPLSILIFYAIFIAVSTFVWFAFLSLLLTSKGFLYKFNNFIPWIYKFTGIVFIISSFYLITL